MKGTITPRRRLGRSLRLSAALLLALVILNPHKAILVDGCGITIHNEIAFRASRILLAHTPSFSSSCSFHSKTNERSSSSSSCPHPHSHSHIHAHSCLHSSQESNASAEKESAGERSLSKSLYDYVPLLEQKESLFAGSFFPDWGYNCIGKIWNAAAEEAHWPPFAEASVKYILETYPKPWTDHTKALITFLFGIVSHSLGDMSWHALQGLDAGFIRAIAETSFDSDYSKGHTLADIGAEFVLSHMSKMDHLVTSWKVPVKDISAIYKRLGHRVPGFVVSHCMRNGYAGAQANARLGGQLFPVYASKSPFLVEQVEDYPMGGLRDMSEWTVDCWNGLAGYLDQERKLPDDEDRKANRTFNMCYALWEERTRNSHMDAMKRTREGMVRHEHKNGHGASSDGLFALSRLELAGMRVVTEADDDTGMVTFSIEEIKETKGEHIDESKVKLEEEEPIAQGKSNVLDELFRSNMQQKFTWKSRVRDETRLRVEQTYSRQRSGTGSSVCISFSDELESQARTLFLPIEYASFGHAVVTGDFNGDGDIDLAVAAPHISLDPLVPSQGAVFIVPGQSLFATDDADSGADVRTVASSVLYGDPTEPQSRFGWSLAVLDLNQDGIDDLAIGAPGHGAKDLKYDGSVFVYFGNQGTGLSKEPDLVIYHDRAKDKEDDVPVGMNTLDGLGYVLQGLDLTGSGFKDLVVGMPMATTPIEPTEDGGRAQRDGGNEEEEGDDDEGEVREFKAQAGKVLVFLSAAKHTGQKLDTDRDWELQGQDAFGWFGASFAVISQAEHSHATSFSTRSLLSSLLSWLYPSVLSHCGSQKAKEEYSEIRRILVVGSPTFGVGEQEAMRGKIQGFLVPEFSKPAFPGEIILPSPVVPQKLFTIHGDSKFQQLGSSLAPNHHASSPEFKGAPSKDFLIVGSQSEDILNRLPRVGRQWQAGMVRILDISQLEDGAEVKISDLDSNPEIVRDSLKGSQSMAHLSAAMEVSTDGKSLWLTEPYAKAEAGRILEWAPNFEKNQEDGDDEDDDGKGSRGGTRGRQRHGRKDVLGVRGRQLVRAEKHGGGDDDDEDNDGDQDRIKQCFIGTDFRGRFGSQLLVADLNKDGMDDIVVTSSHASQYATMAGTVTIKFRS